MLIKPIVKDNSPAFSVSNNVFHRGGICYSDDLKAGLIYLTLGDEYPILALEDWISLSKLIHNHKRGNFENCTSKNWLLCTCRFAKIVRADDMLLIGNYWDKLKVMEVL